MPLTTFDGKYDIAKVRLTTVYFVPKDRKPLADWQDRVAYFLRRITAFHEREFDGQSVLDAPIPSRPLISDLPTEAFRVGDQNKTFWDTMANVKKQLPWKPQREAGQRNGPFPVLLVLSEINWRELDDFARTRIINGRPEHEGYKAPDGSHFPGAESGGARATYFDNEGYGMGLVSADGWRVPYRGSDCVVYHEGLGHTLGIPHPEPQDTTVMGTAQYNFWLGEARLNRSQKERMGWRPPSREKDLSRDLFTQFTAIPQPSAPKPGEQVVLNLKWPQNASVRSLVLRMQTRLGGAWSKAELSRSALPPPSIKLGTFARPTPVSYRVDVTLNDGQSVELRGYFQVNER